MAAKTPNPIDVHVGGHVRMRRIEVNMSQQILGGHIGLTFQQVQKYEKGTNRIGPAACSRSAESSRCQLPIFSKAHPADGRLARAAGRRTHFSNCSAQGWTAACPVIFQNSRRQAATKHRRACRAARGNRRRWFAQAEAGKAET
jgi:DNA-binding XRE family transcriptional regulator